MSSCQIGYATMGSIEVTPCDKRAVAKCADCGTAICSDCLFSCCGDLFCGQCDDYHVTHTCLKKPVQNECISLPDSAACSPLKRAR
jgi:hypothetical protein